MILKRHVKIRQLNKGKNLFQSLGKIKTNKACSNCHTSINLKSIWSILTGRIVSCPNCQNYIFDPSRTSRSTFQIYLWLFFIYLMLLLTFEATSIFELIGYLLVAFIISGVYLCITFSSKNIESSSELPKNLNRMTLRRPFEFKTFKADLLINQNANEIWSRLKSAIEIHHLYVHLINDRKMEMIVGLKNDVDTLQLNVFSKDESSEIVFIGRAREFGEIPTIKIRFFIKTLRNSILGTKNKTNLKREIKIYELLIFLSIIVMIFSFIVIEHFQKYFQFKNVVTNDTQIVNLTYSISILTISFLAFIFYDKIFFFSEFHKYIAKKMSSKYFKIVYTFFVVGFPFGMILGSIFLLLKSAL